MAYVWGDNAYGQCGYPGIGVSNFYTPVLQKSLVNLKVTAVACGAAHTIVITDQGSTYSWGLNSFGQCGI
jgi:alpha-tubulin suppressor-like RCC1 family protein